MTAMEFDAPNWAPLAAKGGPQLCCEFMWMWRKSGIEFSKHIRTRRYLLLDSEGRCYRQTVVGFEAADLGTELKRARGE